MPGVLIVDDDPLVARAISDALLSEEAVVIVHGASAAEAYISRRLAWTAFIIDVVLGVDGESGFDVLAAAKNRHPETPAVLVTGHHNPEWDARARSFGVQLMRKPLSVPALRRFVEGAGGSASAPVSTSLAPTRSAVRRGRVIVADDDQFLRHNLACLLEREGFEVTTVSTRRLRDEIAVLQPGASVLTNVSLRAAGGHDDFIETLRRERPDVRIVVGARSLGLVGSIMRAAHARWLDDTPETADLRTRLFRALGCEVARAEPETAAAPSRPGGGTPRAMTGVFDLADKIARSARAPALLVGESGVGKEVIATRIHEQSARSKAPFIRLNLAAIGDGMLEAELFGSVRGAFTDSKRDRPGLVASADGGTLLLDEIGECRPEIQAKLLRVIENHTFFPVGSDKERLVDVRIVAATNRPPVDLNNGGTLRTDLLFRLGTVIMIPPLRERRDEILPLAEQFARDACAENRRPPVRLTRAACLALEAHDWPGNVRELKHAIERAVMLSDDGHVDADALDLHPRTGTPSSSHDGGLADARIRAERAEIISSLAAVGGSATLAARRLGVSRSTFYDKMRKHNLR